MKEKEIDWYIKEMLKYDKGEKNVVANVIEFKKSHINWFIGRFNRGFIKYFEIAFDSIIESNYQINFEDKTERPEQRTIQWLLIKNNLMTLYWAFELLTAWSYVDSLILIRSLFESLIKLIYLSHFPDQKEQVIIPIPWTKQFNLTKFQEKLGIDWSYKLLSTYSHSNWYHTLKEISSIVKEWEKNPIEIVLEKNEDEASRALNRINFIIWNYVYFIKEFLLSKNESFYLKLTDIERGYFALFKSLSISHPKNSFYTWAKEAIHIYENMKNIEISRLNKK